MMFKRISFIIGLYLSFLYPSDINCNKNYTHIKKEYQEIFYEKICKQEVHKYVLQATNHNNININCKKNKIDYVHIPHDFQLSNSQDITIQNCVVLHEATISIKNSHVLFKNNTIISYEEQKNKPNIWGQTRENLSKPLFYLPSQTQNNVSFISNTLFSLNPYTKPFLECALQKKTNTSQKHTLHTILISNNKFNNFHGVLLLGNATGSITNNIFFRNSFNNIFIKDSNNIMIDNNQILFSGNGTSGDAIAVFNTNNLKIISNTIIGGSCYGIFITGVSNNIQIEKNTISDDITSALHFINLKTSTLIINHNNFINNDGWAIGFDINISIENFFMQNNIFHNNNHYKQFFGKDIYYSPDTEIVEHEEQDNISLDPWILKPAEIKNSSKIHPFNLKGHSIGL